MSEPDSIAVVLSTLPDDERAVAIARANTAPAAPHAPCAKRAISRTSMFEAAATTPLAATKPTRAAIVTRRLPHRSAARPIGIWLNAKPAR